MTENDKRFESVILGISGIADILDTQTEMLRTILERQAALEEWLKAPPSSELPDLLRKLVLAVEEMPERVAAEVKKVVTS